MIRPVLSRARFDVAIDTSRTDIIVCRATCTCAASSSVHEGPLYLLACWRRRMQVLTSLSEQMKRKEVRSVIGALQASLRFERVGAAEELWKQNVATLLRRWKAIDADLTEATVEAKVGRPLVSLIASLLACWLVGLLACWLACLFAGG